MLRGAEVKARLAPEGYPFVGASLLMAFIGFFIATWACVVFTAVTLFMMYFFRDPDRTAPPGENVFVSPADGKIILVQKVFEDRFLKAETRMISIFMSPLDVHVNRSPCDGTVESVIHTPGKFLSAFKQEASLQNENIAVILGTRYGRVLVRQVAGFVARRAVCRVAPGAFLKKGERYGIIKFSSRLDIFLPETADIAVALGDRVRAGETVLAVAAGGRTGKEERGSDGSA